MRICVVTTSFPKFLGDSEGTFVWEAAQAVARQGHQVRVITLHGPNLPTREWMENIEVIRPRYWWPESKETLRKEGGGLPVILRKYWLARFQVIPFILVHTIAVARYARGCDVVHTQWTLSAGAAWLSRAIHRRPILATLQGSDIYQVTQYRLGAWLTRFVLRRCDYISAVSSALAEATTALGIPPAALSVVPNGVNVAQFVPPSNPRELLLLYVGNLIKIKGVEYLLEAMSAIARRYPSFSLLLVGDGPERASLEKLAADLGITEKVTFAGRQPPEEVRRCMQRAKLLVHPSLQEGLSVVLLEALASGIPIVATRVGGNPESVTNEVGLLVPPADSDALAEAIGRLLSDDKLWTEMSRNARARAEKHYNWDRIAAQYIALYKRISG